MMDIPLDIYNVITENIADTRAIGATCRQYRAIFIATDWKFWRRRGIERARLATPRTSQFVSRDRVIAANNLPVLLHIGAGDDVQAVFQTAIMTDSAAVFAHLLPSFIHGNAKRIFLRACICGAVKCARIMADFKDKIKSSESGSESSLIANNIIVQKWFHLLDKYVEIIFMCGYERSAADYKFCAYAVAVTTPDPVVRKTMVDFIGSDRAEYLSDKWIAAMRVRLPELRRNYGKDAFFNTLTCNVTPRVAIKYVRKMMEINRDSPHLIEQLASVLEVFSLEYAAICRRMAARAHKSRHCI